MTDKHIVIYTDGSARPNPGFNGWGVHGYLCIPSDKAISNSNIKHVPTLKGYTEKKTIKKNDTIDYCEVLEYYDWFGGYTTPRTNNAAELLSFIKGISKILEIHPDVSSITICTDSEYLRKGVEQWLPKWMETGWKTIDNKPVINADLWEEISLLLDKLNDSNIEYSLIKVPAHSNILGNERADTLALIGTLYGMNGSDKEEYTITDPNKYWARNIEKHPFISFKRMLFNTVPEYNTRGHYFIAEHIKEKDDSKREQFGRKLPNASYAVIELDKHDPVVELLKNLTYTLTRGLNMIGVMRLDRVFDPDIHFNYEKHGENIAIYNYRKYMSIDYLDGKPVTVVLEPSCLAFKSIQYSSILEDILKAFKSETPIETKSGLMAYRFTNVNNYFYDEKGKLNKDITSQTKIVTINTKLNKLDGTSVDVNIPITIGSDLPKRNDLKKLEKHEPTVYLATWWESEHHLRYNVVIKTNDGLGVWSNFFVDSIFIK